jgi:hypothetical protein
MTSRMSGSVHGSMFAGGRLVPGAEEDLECVGQLGMLEDMERFAARLMHLCPWNAVGQVSLVTLPYAWFIY